MILFDYEKRIRKAAKGEQNTSGESKLNRTPNIVGTAD